MPEEITIQQTIASQSKDHPDEVPLELAEINIAYWTGYEEGFIKGAIWALENAPYSKPDAGGGRS